MRDETGSRYVILFLTYCLDDGRRQSASLLLSTACQLAVINSQLQMMCLHSLLSTAYQPAVINSQFIKVICLHSLLSTAYQPAVINSQFKECYSLSQRHTNGTEGEVGYLYLEHGKAQWLIIILRSFSSLHSSSLWTSYIGRMTFLLILQILCLLLRIQVG